MKNVLYLVTFIAGAAVGAIAGITYVKKNYDISEKKEEAEKTPNSDNKESVAENEQEELIRRTNADILKSVDDPDQKKHMESILNQYTDMTSMYGSDTISTKSEPYKILPDQFSEFEDYSAIELTLYSDGIITDDRDDIIDNPEELLGKSFRQLFDEGSDELFIRNDDRCTDYAIYKDVQTFEAYDETRPHFRMEE